MGFAKLVSRIQHSFFLDIIVTASTIVIVESPAKAKTIGKYLGSAYKVEASYGHVRDLSPKDGAVDPDRDFAMQWLLMEKSKQRVAVLAKAARGANAIMLATDPDREGEAIAWHVLHALRESGIDVDSKQVSRVVFHEITKTAIQKAVAAPREINQELVDAYFARRGLDFLVGFTLSPILWRRLPGSRSAGRVQSVVLRLIAERDVEIRDFVQQEFWQIMTEFLTEDVGFTAQLQQYQGNKLEKFSITTAEQAAQVVEELRATTGHHVAKVVASERKRYPTPPFITSTLQQEASRRFGFSATRTMRVAQQLYEGVSIEGATTGLITYMRTDSVVMAKDAIEEQRKTIAQKFGKAYLPDSPVTYKTKSKNAQEAHECIRPTDFSLDPDRIGSALDEDQRKLYGLIWQRAMAAGMTPARFEQTAVDIEDATKQHRWHVTGSVQLFDGFLRLYQEQEHEHESKESKAVQTDKRLPPLKAKQEVLPKSTLPERHETQPPPRFTEASLVKKMESLSIGRPSTYASIMKLLQDRNYVTLDRKRFVATTQGHLVTTFLKSFFTQYVDVHFSAQMEDSLDSVACGDMVWLQLMRTFWKDFHQRVNEVAGMEHATIRGELDRALREVLLGSAAESAPTTCPRCKNGTLSLGISKYGVFLGCSGYPECEYKLPLQEPTRATEGGAVLEVQDSAYPIQLGVDQGLPVSIRQGPYGLYFQRGETQKGSKVKPARAAIPEGIDPTLLGLDQALRYLSLPRTIGQYPETGENIIANRGPYGPYIKCGYLNAKLENDDEVFSIGINRAIDLIASRPKRGEVLGKHPATGLDVVKLRSRFGTDVASGEFRARIPRGTTEEVTLDMALALLAKKAGTGKKKAPAKKGTSAHARQARQAR